jgi:predicted nucleotidyltransferase
MSRQNSTITQSNTRTKSTHATRARRALDRAVSARPRWRRVTRRQIDAVVQKIVQEFNPEKVILFGSYAYGKPNADSDVDLLVVMESDERPARRAIRVVRQLLDVPFPMDVLVRTPQEVRQRLQMNDCFVREIVERGRVLYEQ